MSKDAASMGTIKGPSIIHKLLVDSQYPNHDLINPFDPKNDWDHLLGVEAANNGLKWKIGDSDSYITVNLDDLHFGLGGNVSLGDCNPLDWVWSTDKCRGKISAYVQPSIKLGGSLKLEIGNQTGSFNLAKQTLIPTERATFPAVPLISAGGQFGATLDASLVIDNSNRNKTFNLSFDATSDNRFSLSIGNGFQIKAIKNAANANADPLTGLKFDASIIPTLSPVIEIGGSIAGVQATIASINGDMIPKETFQVDGDSGELLFNVLIGASADFLRISGISDGFHYDIAKTSVYNTSVDLW